MISTWKATYRNQKRLTKNQKKKDLPRKNTSFSFPRKKLRSQNEFEFKLIFCTLVAHNSTRSQTKSIICIESIRWIAAKLLPKKVLKLVKRNAKHHENFRIYFESYLFVGGFKVSYIGLFLSIHRIWLVCCSKYRIFNILFTNCCFYV